MLWKLIIVRSVFGVLLISAGCSKELEPLSYETGAPRSAQEDRLFAQFLNACASGDERRVREFVDGEGVSLVNAQTTETGATALERATEFGHVEVVNLLIARGAQPNISGKDNRTALLQAAYKGFVPIVDALLKAGANPNIAESRYGDTALILAAWKGHREVVEKLVLAGADVNAHSKDGRTALQQALQKKDVSMAKFLREHGASERDNAESRTPKS